MYEIGYKDYTTKIHNNLNILIIYQHGSFANF